MSAITENIQLPYIIFNSSSAAQISWGNISGDINSQEDLINFIQGIRDGIIAEVNVVKEQVEEESARLGALINFVDELDGELEELKNLFIEKTAEYDIQLVELSNLISAINANIASINTTISEIQIALSTKLDITNSASKLYGTDANGNQVLYGVNEISGGIVMQAEIDSIKDDIADIQLNTVRGIDCGIVYTPVGGIVELPEVSESLNGILTAQQYIGIKNDIDAAKFDEAPFDDKIYGRKNGGWEVAVPEKNTIGDNTLGIQYSANSLNFYSENDTEYSKIEVQFSDPMGCAAILTASNPNTQNSLAVTANGVYICDNGVEENPSKKVVTQGELSNFINANDIPHVITGVSQSIENDTVKLHVSKTDTSNANTAIEIINLPIANGINGGIMPSSAFNLIEELNSKVESIEGRNKRIPVTDELPQTLSNEEVNNIYAAVTGGASPTDGDTLISLNENTLDFSWVFFGFDNLWHFEGTNVVLQATQDNSGIIKGSYTDGQCFVEVDGRLSVNGYDNIINDISTLNISKLDKKNTANILYGTDENGEYHSYIIGDDIPKYSNGNITVSSPIINTDAANKYYVDNSIINNAVTADNSTLSMQNKVLSIKSEYKNKIDNAVSTSNISQTIQGLKTFTSSPVMPAKYTMPLIANTTLIATEAQVVTALNSLPQPDWNEIDTSHKSFIKNKPTKLSQFYNDSNYITDPGYVHTDANFSVAEKLKLNNIEFGAEVNVNADWNETLSTSDSYIKNKPYISNTVIKNLTYDNVAHTLNWLNFNKLNGSETPDSAIIPTATPLIDGLISAEDKEKLDGVAENANNYIPDTQVALASGLYKITTNNYGYVINGENVNKSDIVALGIPAQDTTYVIENQGSGNVVTDLDINNGKIIATYGNYIPPSTLSKITKKWNFNGGSGEITLNFPYFNIKINRATSTGVATVTIDWLNSVTWGYQRSEIYDSGARNGSGGRYTDSPRQIESDLGYGTSINYQDITLFDVTNFRAWRVEFIADTANKGFVIVDEIIEG